MMSLNEAKEVFINRAFILTDDGSDRIHDPEKWREACYVISKWLEQEPCEDAISRRAVLDLVCADWKYENLEADIASLSPVTPQPEQRWIPVSERLPEEGKEVLVSGYDTYHKKVIIARYQGEQYGFTCGLVSAWMPLPEPMRLENE